ncbi:sodium:calcium antiporter [Mycobacterium sp. SWH-M5]|nr:sodium:calcium antiporter [Mycobacterium sp. SWH-M5]
MLGSAAWFAVGLVALAFGSEMMVRGGAQMASRMGISPIVVGLTVVSIGTSLPELAVGVTAAVEGSGALAVGNIAGTNIVNLLFILGLSALLRPLAIQHRTLRLDLPAMAVAAVLFWVLSVDGTLSRVDGAILLCSAIAYTVVVVRSARSETRDLVDEYASAYRGQGYQGEPIGDDETPAHQAELRRTGGLVRHVAMTVVGITIVVVGAEWLVDGAVGIAREFGVSDALIGLTIVAIGTSAPELVTTIVSTMRGERDIAIGNLLGSSVYNIVLILGVTCLVPGQGLPLTSNLVWIDIPVMVAATLILIPVFFSGRRVHRAEGAAMVVVYLAYLTVLLVTQT